MPPSPSETFNNFFGLPGLQPSFQFTFSTWCKPTHPKGRAIPFYLRQKGLSGSLLIISGNISSLFPSHLLPIAPSTASSTHSLALNPPRSSSPSNIIKWGLYKIKREISWEEVHSKSYQSFAFWWNLVNCISFPLSTEQVLRKEEEQMWCGHWGGIKVMEKPWVQLPISESG